MREVFPKFLIELRQQNLPIGIRRTRRGDSFRKRQRFAIFSQCGRFFPRCELRHAQIHTDLCKVASNLRIFQILFRQRRCDPFRFLEIMQRVALLLGLRQDFAEVEISSF